MSEVNLDTVIVAAVRLTLRDRHHWGDSEGDGVFQKIAWDALLVVKPDLVDVPKSEKDELILRVMCAAWKYKCGVPTLRIVSSKAG